MPCIAKVAVNDATIHFDKLYSYLVPPDFSESLWPGSIVLVPFGRGNHPRMAVVLEVGTEEAPDPRLKSLLAAAPEKARLTPDLLEPGTRQSRRSFRMARSTSPAWKTESPY